MMEVCERCLWREECTGVEGGCEHYYPLEEDVNQLIEQRRQEFYEEWNEYIGGFYK